MAHVATSSLVGCLYAFSCTNCTSPLEQLPMSGVTSLSLARLALENIVIIPYGY